MNAGSSFAIGAKHAFKVRMRVCVYIAIAAGSLAGACSETDGQEMTKEDCTSVPGASVESSDDSCRRDFKNLGEVRDEGELLGSCCVRPDSLSFADCTQMGGEQILDPGDGSTYDSGCPEDSELLGWLDKCATSLCGEGGICCTAR